MARKSAFGSQTWIWVSLMLALSAGISVCSWQSDVQTLRERNWTFKTSAGSARTNVPHSLLNLKPTPTGSIAVSAIEPAETRAIDSQDSAEDASEEAAPIAVEPFVQPLLPPIAGPDLVANPSTETKEIASSPALPLEEERLAETPPAMEIVQEMQIARAPEKADDRPLIPERIVAMPEEATKATRRTSCIAEPVGLLADVARLKQVDSFSQYAELVDQALADAQSVSSLEDKAFGLALERLESIRQLGLETAQANHSDLELPMHLRVVHGLTRRIEIWKAMIGVDPSTATSMAAAELQAEPLRLVVQELTEELKSAGNLAGAANWAKFLLLPELRAAQSGKQLSAAELEILQRISTRAQGDSLTEAQRAFLTLGPPRDFLAAIEMYLVERPAMIELLEALEAYEAEPSQAGAQAICLWLARFTLSSDPAEAALGAKLTNFYRAGNVRVAIAESLINQLIPAPSVSQESVNDHLMGARVTGRSNVSTRLRVQLVPDKTRWRVGLEATGDVSSNTQAFHGPFTFFNQGWANYRARTTVGLGKRGFDVNQPTAEATSQTDLLDLQSDFDGIPLFGLLARSVARQQHAKKEVEAEWEVEGRMARRIEQKLDSELQTRIGQVEKEWTNRVAQPLEGLRLAPTPIAMETTTERLIARYRVAGDSQLAANTARPLAPSDSVLSVQLHVSAINNFIEQLDLDGKTFKLEELFLHLTKAMGSTETEIPEDMPENIYVRFADSDALRMDVRDGQAQLTVRLAEIRQGRSKWKNVQVRGHFTPKISGLNAELERTSYVELKGDGLKKIGGGQVILRVAFTSVLSRVSNVPLVHPKLTQHPQMQGFEIRQCVLDDGWIGLAIGPKLSTASAGPREATSETARRPKSPVVDRILR
jgi:hypothetical protein